MKPVYIFIGIPGSGKDTQAALLSEELGLPHVDAGKTFREVIRNKSKYWDYIQETYTHSLPIPSDMFFKIMTEKFLSESCSKGFILSQNTKSVEEADDLNKLLNEIGFTLHKVFFLDIERETAISRALERLNGVFTEKEPDEETLVKRIDTYIDIIPAIKEYYTQKGILVLLDGEQHVDEIFKQVRHSFDVQK
jgi:adenylate kinase